MQNIADKKDIWKKFSNFDEVGANITKKAPRMSRTI